MRQFIVIIYTYYKLRQYVLQWLSLNVITLVQDETGNINRLTILNESRKKIIIKYTSNKKKK